MKPHRGTLILVLGILGLVVCAPLAIAAWVMGSGDLKQMDAGTMDPSGRGTTQAGKICGIIGTILLIIGVIVCRYPVLYDWFCRRPGATSQLRRSGGAISRERWQSTVAVVKALRDYPVAFPQRQIEDGRKHSRKWPVFVNRRVAVPARKSDTESSQLMRRSFLCTEPEIRAASPEVNL